MIVLDIVPVLVVGMIVSFFIGYKVHARVSIDYKQRWLEAVKLNKELSMAPLTDTQMLGAAPHEGYRLVIEYKKIPHYSGPCAVFFAVRGKEKIRLGSVTNYTTWMSTFDRRRNEYHNTVNEMNKEL